VPTPGIVEKVIRDLVNAGLPQHPLTYGATRLPAGARAVIVHADVSDQRVPATYAVSEYGSGLLYRVDPTVSSLDQLVNTTRDLFAKALATYDRQLLSRLSSEGHAGFNGIGTFVPPSVGTHVIGGIHELQHPGWRSQVEPYRESIGLSLLSLDVRCTSIGRSPDLMMLGKNRYYDLIQQMQPQQRFSEVHRGISMLKLYSSAVYPDSYADPDAAYVIHADDFQLHVGIPIVTVEVNPDGLRVSIKRAEQLTAKRRFRSGRIIEPQFG
jgi:hypothetical protein